MGISVEPRDLGLIRSRPVVIVYIGRGSEAGQDRSRYWIGGIEGEICCSTLTIINMDVLGPCE